MRLEPLEPGVDPFSDGTIEQDPKLEPLPQGADPFSQVVAGGLQGVSREALQEILKQPSRSALGIRSMVAASLPPPTPEDEASPIDTADIMEGRRITAEAEAQKKANGLLDQLGLPRIGMPVRVTQGGEALEGVVADAFDDGLSLASPDGMVLDMSLSRLMQGGGNIEGMPLPPSQADMDKAAADAAKEAERLAQEEQKRAEEAAKQADEAEAADAEALAEAQREADQQILYRDELEGATGDVADLLSGEEIGAALTTAFSKMGITPDHDIAADPERRDTFKTLYTRALHREHRRRQAEAQQANESAAVETEPPAAGDDATAAPDPAEPPAGPAAALVMRENGEAFRTDKSAALAAKMRGIDAAPVQVEGGWALQPTPSTDDPDGTAQRAKAIEAVARTATMALPSLGAHHAAIGIKRRNKAQASRGKGIPNGDARLLEQHGIADDPAAAATFLGALNRGQREGLDSKASVDRALTMLQQPPSPEPPPALDQFLQRQIAFSLGVPRHRVPNLVKQTAAEAAALEFPEGEAVQAIAGLLGQ